MKILVTGGAGFIGSHVCEALLSRGDSVVCLDNFNNFYDPLIKKFNISSMIKNKDFKLYHMDITYLEDLENVFETEQPDIVVHIAASAGVRPSIANPQKYIINNMIATTSLLKLSAKHNVKNFVFASSSSVYGDRNRVPFRESEQVTSPISPYAATKRAGELIAYTYSHLYSLNVTCLRFFTVYGPRGRPDMAPYKFTKAIHEEKPIEMFGDGSSIRDYTYVGDVVKAVLASIDNPSRYEIINIGNSNPISLIDFIKLIEKVVGKKAIIIKSSKQKGDVRKTYADIRLAKKVLGWQPTVPLKEGLKETYEYIKMFLKVKKIYEDERYVHKIIEKYNS